MKRFIVPCLLVGVFILAVGNLEAGQRAEGARRLEEALHRGCVACYALEGSYPEDIDHLIDYYGIQVDSRYIVHYEVIASNLMPDITVTERGK